MNLTSPNILRDFGPQGSESPVQPTPCAPLTEVEREIDDMRATLAALYGREPTAGELMEENLRRRTGLSFCALRKQVDNALIVLQNAEIDAKLAELKTGPDRVAFFASCYRRPFAERQAEEARAALYARIAKGREQ